ncbi:MAG TPA: single-stranded DNA-binding protein [Candidatus Limnocylindrales bacterium]
MFDTPITLIGNVLVDPKVRRTVETRQLAASFRVASTSRRYDKETQTWVDGQSLRLRVTCWRKLAEGVAASLHVGDPVIVTGRLYTRDWIDEEGNHRVLYEMDAHAVGHDLARGTGTFERHKARLSTSAIEDEEAERRIGGEDSVPEDLDPTPKLHADGFTTDSLTTDGFTTDAEDSSGDDFSTAEIEGQRELVAA